MDTLSPEKRSWNMSRIRNKDTKPELVVRSLLHRMGYRFRLHRKDLPGNPDIVLPKYKVAIFVHGCFWHRHPGCKYAYTPKTDVEKWQTKFERNAERDREVESFYLRCDWTRIVIWECVTKNPEALLDLLARSLPPNLSRKSPNLMVLDPENTL